MRNSIDFLTILATAYSDTSEEAPAEETFTIPEDFSELSDEALTELHSKAVEHFDSLYGDGNGLTDEDLETLGQLSDGIETLSNEASAREAAASERAEKGRALAAKVKPGFNSDSEDGAGGDDSEDEDSDDSDSDDSDSDDSDSDDEEEDDEDSSTEDESAAETVTASAKRKPVHINLGNVRSRAKHQAATPKPAPKQMRDIVASGETGEGADWNDLAQQMDRRLASFPANQYSMAHKRGQHIREQHSLAVVRKPYTEDQLVASSDPQHIEEVVSRAVDQSKLPGGSLVASGGWCAPSETLYDFLELESTDGLLSLPEVVVNRGGIQFTQGPLFSDIYSATGFSFTEEEDIAGDYSDPGGPFAGNKPFYKIECPEFQEERLEVDGLYLTAGILQQRGYPEVIARTLRGALVAHEHRMSANAIGRIIAGSDVVNIPSPQVGVAAPILNSIDLQVQHYRYTHRLPFAATLEAVFPAWTHSAVKADLARRDGLDYLAVTDAQVNGWFAARNISPQYVYDWQALTGSAGDFTEWPDQLSFLLYVAGTWVRGTADLLTLDTVYDSTNLGQNDFIALFSEEGWLVGKRGHDSRLVTVPLNASGSTGESVLIGHDGTPAEVGGGA